MYSFKIQAPAVLLPYLFEKCPGVSRTRVKKWLGLQCVSVNGKAVTRHDLPLRAGDEISVQPGKKTPLAKKGSVKILYQDEHILVADKPEGLLTVATEKVKTKTAYYELNEWLAESKQRVFIVHRLDRETSGLLVFAKTEASKFKLQKNWGRVEKHYTAVVEGTPKKKEDTIQSHLAQNKTLKVYSTEENEYSKLAVTEYKVLKSDGQFSLLDVNPRTGRKNQIRVQLADMGHPIAGDKKYGAKTDPAGRLALHAHSLSFIHPVTLKKMEFKSPIPTVLTQILQ